jgi:acetyl esterase/lipase
VSRLAVLIGDRRDQVDDGLLGILLRRWAERAGVAVEVSVVPSATVAAAYADAAASADGIVIDAALDGDGVTAASPVPVVSVDVTNNPPAPDGVARTIYGRGIDTYVWAARHLAAWLRSPGSIIAYGDHRDHVGELRVPAGAGPHPVVVLIHGGFWHHFWERDLMDDLAIDLVEAGLATWNIEYRRGPGSWAFAIADVARAVDHLRLLAYEHRLATDRIALAGHSAGGQLALWAAARPRHGPRAETALTPALVVPLAPVSDLVECAARNLGQGAAVEFIGATPEAEPGRYRALDPLQRLPVGVATTIVQGMADGPDLIDLNRRFTARASEVGDAVELHELDDADHFDVIDARSDAWAHIRGVLVEGLAEGDGG